MSHGEESQSNGWGEWRRHVLIEMESLRKTLEEINKEMSGIKTDIALLKYKSSIWGAAGAGLVILIYAAINYLTKK